MKQIIFLSLLAAGFQGNAQGAKGQEFTDGWAETKKGDTLRGKICIENTKTGERYEKIFFLDAANLKKRYGAEKLVSFSTQGKIYEYIVIEEVPIPLPMERLISGDIYLYKAWFTTPQSTPQKMAYETALFLKKKDRPEFTEVLEKKFLKEMQSYFRGDEDIVAMIKENN